MPFTAAAKNTMLDALAIDAVSLHTGDPGADGSANEVAGGAPAYARKAIAFAAAAAASRDSTVQPVFDVPAGTTVAYVGFWASGAFQGSKAVTNEAFASQGTYTLSDADLNLNDPA